MRIHAIDPQIVVGETWEWVKSGEYFGTGIRFQPVRVDPVDNTELGWTGLVAHSPDLFHGGATGRELRSRVRG